MHSTSMRYEHKKQGLQKCSMRQLVSRAVFVPLWALLPQDALAFHWFRGQCVRCGRCFLKTHWRFTQQRSHWGRVLKNEHCFVCIKLHFRLCT